MKIKVSVKDLKEALSGLTRIVGKNGTPIMNNLLFNLDNKSLVIIGRNLSSQKTIKLNVESTDSGSFSLPFVKLNSLVKTLADDKKASFNAKDGKVVVSCGKSRSTISQGDSDNFPVMTADNLNEISVDLLSLANAVSLVSFASGKNDAMQMINSVVLSPSQDGNMDVVSTNKAVMAIKTISCKNQFSESIIPIRLKDIVIDGLSNGSKIETNGKIISISGSNFVTLVSLMDYKFINYKVGVPRTRVIHELTFDKEAMSDCLNRISAIADDPEKSRCIINAPVDSTDAVIQGRFLIGDSNEIDESISVSNKSEVDMSIAYNPSFLLNAINKTERDVVTCTIHDGQLAPMVITDNSLTIVITQVRI